MKEFGLSEEQIMQGMRSGKLQYRENYAHGNPYFRLLRSELEIFATEINGIEGVQRQKTQHRLNEIKKQINSLKRKLKSLENEKARLVEIETMLDVSAVGISYGHSRCDFPYDVRPGCSYNEVCPNVNNPTGSSKDGFQKRRY